MGNFGYGFHVLWRIWRDGSFAEKVREIESGKRLEAGAPAAAGKAEAPKPKRSEAVTLLAVLQREARFLDFIKESISGYSDAQIGAAVRDVHKGCGTVIERVFAPEPLVNQAEGTEVEVPEGYDPVQFRLTGNVTGGGARRGTICHHGWKATRVELPEWTGSKASTMILAPSEVEVK